MSFSKRTIVFVLVAFVVNFFSAWSSPYWDLDALDHPILASPRIDEWLVPALGGFVLAFRTVQLPFLFLVSLLFPRLAEGNPYIAILPLSVLSGIGFSAIVHGLSGKWREAEVPEIETLPDESQEAKERSA